MPVTVGRYGRVSGVVVDDVMYVVWNEGPSRYRLDLGGGVSFPFVCLCCCDDIELTELTMSIALLAFDATVLGAKKVVCRKSPFSMIAGLPVEDVENHLGDIGIGKIVWKERSR